MATLLFTDPRFAEHSVSPGHPERPERLVAVERGLATSGVGDDVAVVQPREATRDELTLVHEAEYLDSLERFCRSGGGHLDPDTTAVPGSWQAAMLAAGSGLDAIERLRGAEADTAFCAVRPPGHHARASRAMGFCLINNVAVAAKALAESGERVVIVDIDAHHGNGTQEMFWNDPCVTYISIHQFPMYPGSGRADEIGGPEAPGGIVNIPVPAHTSGDTYRRAIDEIIVPLTERIAPTWMLLSTGFDAHRADPITDLGLSSGDYGDLTARLIHLVPAAHTIVFLEGGYDLEAVADSTAATLAAMSGVDLRPEKITSGTEGSAVIDRVRAIHHLG